MTSEAPPLLPRPPRYGEASLSDVLPAVLTSLGVAGHERPSAPRLPAAERACVFLVDGLGHELLTAADPSDAPFLRSLLPGAAVLDAGFPTSTPISLCSLGTGRTPGEHGIVGFTMHVPPVPNVLECLAWIDYETRADLSAVLPPETLQACEPLLSSATHEGIATTVVSLGDHVGSGLTRAAFRGAVFDSVASFDDLEGRVGLVGEGLRRSDRALVYTYDARLDAAAHVDGVGSVAWRTALAETDATAAALAGALPPGSLFVVTGDHGAVNVPATARIDFASRSDLAADVAWLSGDPRTRHVHARNGRADNLIERWTAGLDDGWVVLARDEAIDLGLFGPLVRDDVRSRIGDVVAIAVGDGGVFDRSRYSWELRLVGFHGALTPAELRVPLLQLIA